MGKATDYTRGYLVGRIKLLQGLTQRLREDEELRTLAGLQEILNAWLEDEQRQLKELK